LRDGNPRWDTDDLLTVTTVNLLDIHTDVLCRWYARDESCGFCFCRDGFHLLSEGSWMAQYAANRLCYFASLIGVGSVESEIRDAYRPGGFGHAEADAEEIGRRLRLFKERVFRNNFGRTVSDETSEGRALLIFRECLAKRRDVLPSSGQRNLWSATAEVTRRELQVLCHYHAARAAGWERRLERASQSGPNLSNHGVAVEADDYVEAGDCVAELDVWLSQLDGLTPYLGESVVSSIHGGHGGTLTPFDGSFCIYEVEELPQR